MHVFSGTLNIHSLLAHRRAPLLICLIPTVWREELCVIFSCLLHPRTIFCQHIRPGTRQPGWKSAGAWLNFTWSAIPWTRNPTRRSWCGSLVCRMCSPISCPECPKSTSHGLSLTRKWCFALPSFYFSCLNERGSTQKVKVSHGHPLNPAASCHTVDTKLHWKNCRV